MNTTERALKPATAAFVAGGFFALAAMSLVQDHMGMKAWLEWEVASWKPASHTVPEAIFMLVASVAVYLWCLATIPKVKFVTRLAAVWKQKTPRAEVVALVGAASGHIDNILDGTTSPTKGAAAAFNLLQQAQCIMREIPEGQWRDTEGPTDP